MRIADKNGVPIEGIERGAANSIVVKNPGAYHKYTKEKERAEEVMRLREDVDEMKSMLSQILNAVKNG
jgi:hypothetical protein